MPRLHRSERHTRRRDGDDRAAWHGIVPARQRSAKAILSAFPDERVRDIVDRHGLPAKTPQTITDPDALFEELATIRERGFALNREEIVPPGSRCADSGQRWDRCWRGQCDCTDQPSERGPLRQRNS